MFLKDFRINNYKELYKEELNHINNLKAKASIDISILTALGACIAKAYVKVEGSCVEFLPNCFKLFYTFLFLSYILSIFAFINTYYNKEVSYYPIDAISTYMDKLNKLSSQNPANKDSFKKLAILVDYDMYISCAKENRQESIRLADCHRHFFNELIVTFVLLVCTYVYKIIVLGV